MFWTAIDIKNIPRQNLKKKNVTINITVISRALVTHHIMITSFGNLPQFWSLKCFAFIARDWISDSLRVVHHTFLMKRSNCGNQQPPFSGISHHVSAVPLHMRLFQWCWLSSLLPHGNSGSLGHYGSWNLPECFFFFFLFPFLAFERHRWDLRLSPFLGVPYQRYVRAAM